MIAAAVVGALASARSPRAARLVAYAMVAMLGAAMTLTLSANARIAAYDSADPLSVTSSQISAAASSFDTTDGGSQRRCDLIRAFGAGTGTYADAMLHPRLNALMLARRGRLFCGFSDGTHPSRFVDVSLDHWWSGHTERLAQLGVTSGCTADPPQFCPHLRVSYSQAETFLARAFSDSATSSRLAEATSECLLERTCASVTRGQMATALALAAGPGASGTGPPLYLVERLWRGSVGAGCSPRRVGLYPPVT